MDLLAQCGPYPWTCVGGLHQTSGIAVDFVLDTRCGVRVATGRAEIRNRLDWIATGTTMEVSFTGGASLLEHER
jgi:hypothetical protein